MKWVDATSLSIYEIVTEAINILREDTDRKVNIRGLKQEWLKDVEATLRRYLTKREAEEITYVRSSEVDGSWIMEIRINSGYGYGV